MAVLKVPYFNPQFGLRLVKRGFCWPAFLFGSWWAISKGMWVAGLLFMTPIESALAFVFFHAQAIRHGGLVLLFWSAWLIYHVTVGWYGNRWLEASLERRGYQADDMTQSAAAPLRQEPTW